MDRQCPENYWSEFDEFQTNSFPYGFFSINSRATGVRLRTVVESQPVCTRRVVNCQSEVTKVQYNKNFISLMTSPARIGMISTK